MLHARLQQLFFNLKKNADFRFFREKSRIFAFETKLNHNTMKLRNLFVAALLLVTGSMSAQQMPEIPVDKGVRIGKLDN